MVRFVNFIIIVPDPSDDYSPTKQNMLRSDRKNGRNNKAAHSTQHRVTFSAEKEPTNTRVGGQKHTDHEERKLSLNPAHLSILKKTNNHPLYNKSIKRKPVYL
jgi:hypothetical protein